LELQDGNLVLGALLLIVGVFVVAKAAKFVVRLAMLAVLAIGGWLFVQGF
jgi:hypothetical protein